MCNGSAQIRLNHDQLRAADLYHDLPARTARRYELIRIRNDREVREVTRPVTGGNGGKHGRALGAIA